jgi:hypothetical protein
MAPKAVLDAGALVTLPDAQAGLLMPPSVPHGIAKWLQLAAFTVGGGSTGAAACCSVYRTV